MPALIDQTCVRAAPLYNNIVIVLSTVTVLEIIVSTLGKTISNIVLALQARTILEIILPIPKGDCSD